MKYNYRRFR